MVIFKALLYWSASEVNIIMIESFVKEPGQNIHQF